MTNYWHQPDISPVLLHIWGPFQIRWYSLLYVGGFLVGRTILKKLSRNPRFLFTSEDVDQIIVWLLIGCVIGARLIYCVVYDAPSFFSNPLTVFQIYKGGLSFHGGLLGVMAGGYLWSRNRGIPFWNLGDAMAIATPLGLAMGRIGNFINGELYGRVSYVPWAIIFRDGGPEPRHPSQLYELFLEGIVLFIFLWLVKGRSKKDGSISVAFLIGYSVCRFIGEAFREPDAQLGYLTAGMTMGQVLSLLQILIAVVLGIYLLRDTDPKPSAR